MSWLFGTEGEGAEGRGVDRLWIGSTVCCNSAAKFWSSLIDDARSEFPSVNLIILRSPASGPLVPDNLAPPRLNLDQFLRQDHSTLQSVAEEVAAEMELTGWPLPVRVELRENEREMLAADLPMECLDSDLFSYVLAWLLNWSNISPDDWNREKTKGRLDACGDDRSKRYEADVCLENRVLPEGLIIRTVSLNW